MMHNLPSKPYLLPFFILIIFLFLPLNSQAQFESLFTPRPLSTVEGLSQAGIEKLARMRANPAYKIIIPISVNDFAETQRDGVLPIFVPSLGITGNYAIKNIEMYNNGDFDWGGQIEGSPENWAIFSRRDGEIFGHFTYNGTGSRIQSIEPGFSVLITSNSDPDYAKSCQTVVEKIKSPEQTFQKSDCGAIREIRVLFLYTQAADAISNPAQESVEMINQMNNVLLNSDINDVVFERAGAAEFINFVETDDPTDSQPHRTDFDRIKSILNGSSTSTSQLRNDRNADIVIMLTDGNYPGVNGISGLAPIQADNAYSIVEADADVNHAVFVHEIGHNLGCRHENDNSTSDPLIGTFANAYVFTPLVQ